MIPLIGWLCYFGEDPKGVADHLEDKAKEVVRRWKVLNEPIKDGTRKPIGWVEDVHKHEWRAQRGKKETSIYEISLNSYFYTTNNQWTKEPDITTRDLKLLIKVRSSVLFDNRPDKSSTDSDGLSLDNKGGATFFSSSTSIANTISQDTIKISTTSSDFCAAPNLRVW